MSESLEALQNIVKFFVKKLEDEPTNLEDFETNYSQVEKNLELLEILKKLILGVGTEEDLAFARKHFEMEVKQAFEKSHEGCITIQLPRVEK